MDRWRGRVALVTGASAGIGAAISKELVLKGMKVVGGARRVEKVEELNAELKDAAGKLYPLQLDVADEESIVQAYDWIAKNLGGVDVLINNAGLYRNINLATLNAGDFHDILKTNVLGLSICSREAIKSMKSRGVDDGHIIHINSVTGHCMRDTPGLGAYSTSKHAVTAITEALRQELVREKSRIRISSISPGLVRSELMVAGGIAEAISNKLYDSSPHLEAQDVADAVVTVLRTPAHVQINEMTLRAVGQVG